MVFFLTQALFQRWNGFTGTGWYEPWSLTTFNTLFTSLPVMIIGIFEKDLEASTLLAVPELYRNMGQKNCGFNFWIYVGWTARAVAEALIIYFCMLTLFANAAITKDNTLFSMGDLSFVAVVIVISMKLQIIEMHNKSIVAGFSVFISTGAVFLWNILLAAVYPPTSIYKARGGFFNGFGQNPTWWMTLIFIVTCVYVLEFSVAAFRKTFFPTDTDVFQELERYQAYKERFEAAAVPEARHGWERYSDELVDARKGSDIHLTVLRR
jgi:phospholipid-translocating ATPase